MNTENDYEKIITDRKLFNETVYTPLSKAVEILKERQNDKDLIKKVEDFLKGNMPEPMKDLNLYAVQFRQIATPNYEGLRFLSIAGEYDLKPLICEYHDDILVSNNPYKYSLGMLHFSNNRPDQNEYMKIVDFSKYNGKSIRNISTLWEESLVNFHKNLFSVVNKEPLLFDASPWFQENGGKASLYYKNLLALFICHGILFENFSPNGKEREFSKNIVLPAIIDVLKLFGCKPLIVPLEPLDMEDDKHWFSYPPLIKESVFKLKTI